MEGYLTEIRYWGPNWAPRNWAFCAGQTMPISSFNAVFSLIGTIYGGDGRTTFLLPDLRGRVAVGSGSGIGLTPRSNGQAGGQEAVTLSVLEMPGHTHTAQTMLSSAQVETARAGAGNTGAPSQGTYPGIATDVNGDSLNLYANTGTAINSAISGSATTTVLNNGSSRSHYNMQSFQVVAPIICLSGIYPSRS